MTPKAQVFISYAREDEVVVRSVYERLSRAGFYPWMDTKNILPGEKWRNSIENAIRNSNIFLICLSKHSVQKRGFLQREIKIALDTFQEMLDGDIYLIPARLEDCDVPESLKDFQWVDLYDEKNWNRLYKAINTSINRRKEEALSTVEELPTKEEIDQKGSSLKYKESFSPTPLQGWLNKFIRRHNCKILIFGLPGCGKTSFIRRISYFEKPQVYSSTQSIDIYQSTFHFDLKSRNPVQISIADYKGDRPSKLLVDPPKSFFGEEDNRNINFIYFMVDLVPPNFMTESLSDKSDPTVSSKDVLEQITQRVKDNLTYISTWSIEQLFYQSHSQKNFIGIKLVINKVDMLTKLISLGYLPPEIDLDILYKPLIDMLASSGSHLNISDFSVHKISVKDGIGVTDLLIDTIENYVNRL